MVAIETGVVVFGRSATFVPGPDPVQMKNPKMSLVVTLGSTAVHQTEQHQLCRMVAANEVQAVSAAAHV